MDRVPWLFIVVYTGCIAASRRVLSAIEPLTRPLTEDAIGAKVFTLVNMAAICGMSSPESEKVMSARALSDWRAS